MAAEIRSAAAPAPGMGAAHWGMWAAFAALIVVIALSPAMTVTGYVMVLMLGATWWSWLGYV